MADSVSSSTPSSPPTLTDVVFPVPSIAHNHPPYEDMILRSIEALKSRKGSSGHAISKYMRDNYSDLPSDHATLLTEHLRSLHYKGVINMAKFCYTLAVRSAKLGRPPKLSLPIVMSKRVRRPKVRYEAALVIKKKQRRSPKATPSAFNGPVYIISEAEQLDSGIFQSFPGAMAIVLPKGILNEKAAKSPIIVFPNVTLTGSSLCKRKPGRPRNDGLKKKVGRPRKIVELPKLKDQCSNGNGNFKSLNIVAGASDRPWRIRDLLVPATPREILQLSGNPRMLDGAQEDPETAISKEKIVI